MSHRIAADIMRYREREKGFIDASKSYWKGYSGDEMREGITESRKRMKMIADEMEALADDILTVATRLKNKDEEISKTVENLLDNIKDIFM